MKKGLSILFAATLAVALIVPAIMIMSPPEAHAAGSDMTFEYDTPRSTSLIQRVTVNWTSDDTTADATGTTDELNGYIVRIVTDPGTPAPDDDYDIVLTDPEGMNLLAKAGDDLADRDTSTSEQIWPIMENYDSTAIGVGLWVPVGDAITISVDNAGTSTQGQLILYIQKK